MIDHTGPAGRGPHGGAPPPLLPAGARKRARGRSILVVTAVLLGISPFGSGALAALEPEPTPSTTPTSSPEPAPSTFPATTLVANTTVLTGRPRSGDETEAQIWVAATGAPARNAILHLAAEGNADLVPRCTFVRTDRALCKLGDLDAQGTTIPLIIRTPRNTKPRTVTLTATVTADPGLSARLKTKIALTPARPTPEPNATTPSPKPTGSSPAPAASSAPPTVPVTFTASPSSNRPSPTPTRSTPPSTAPASEMLPQIAPGPTNTFSDEGIAVASPTPLPSAAPPRSVTLLGNSLAPIPSALPTVVGLWLGALFSAVSATFLVCRRRGLAARSRPIHRRRATRRTRQPLGSPDPALSTAIDVAPAIPVETPHRTKEKQKSSRNFMYKLTQLTKKSMLKPEKQKNPLNRSQFWMDSHF